MGLYKKYEKRARNPDPKTSALLVIDVQNYFFDPILPNLLQTIQLADTPPSPSSSRATPTLTATTACLRSGGTATSSRTGQRRRSSCRSWRSCWRTWWWGRTRTTCSGTRAWRSSNARWVWRWWSSRVSWLTSAARRWHVRLSSGDLRSSSPPMRLPRRIWSCTRPRSRTWHMVSLTLLIARGFERASLGINERNWGTSTSAYVVFVKMSE